MSIIHEAIEERNFDDVKAFLEADPSNRDATDGLGNQPIHIAAYTGQAAVAKLLLDLGADVNARGDFDKTPLHYAALEEELAIAELLIKHGADLAPVDAHGNTPLFYAVQGQLDLTKVAQILLNHGVPIDLRSAVWLSNARELEKRVASEPEAIKKTFQPEHLVCQAVIKGDIDSVEALIKHGAPVNGKENACPLFFALARPDILKKLLEAGADLRVRDSSGETVYQNAKKSGASKEVLDLLHQFGAEG